MSLALKLDRARQSLEYWQKMSEDPKLSALAARAMRDRVRYYRDRRHFYDDNELSLNHRLDATWGQLTSNRRL
jgi:hypothetical protein